VLTLLNTNRELLLLAIIAVILGTLSLSSGHFENPDAHLRLSQSFSIVNNGDFKLSDGVGNIQHGNIAENDKGDRYSVYAPGQIILFTPGTLLSQAFSIPGILHPHYLAELINSFLGIATHFLTGIVIYLAAISLGRSRKDALIIGLLFSLSTFNLPSSRDGYEHTYESIFIILSFTTIWIAGKNKENTHYKNPINKYLIAGVFIGIGILFRPTTILALPGLFIISGNRSNIIKVVLGITPGLIVLAIYNQIRFGSPIETGYLQAWLAANPELDKSTVFSIGATLKHAIALWLSPGKGMLLFSPILLSLLFLRKRHWKIHSRAFIAILITAGTYTFFYASNFAWHGSAWCWGPRYLAPITPLLILLVPSLSLKNPVGVITLVLAFISTIVQFSAVLVNYKRHLLETYLTAPEAFKDDRIFFDITLSPLYAIPKNFFYNIDRLGTSSPIYNFITPGPWKNEARTVDIRTMLDASLDLNVFDLWWIRIIHYPVPDTIKYICLLIGIVTFLGFLFVIKQLINRVYQ